MSREYADEHHACSAPFDTITKWTHHFTNTHAPLPPANPIRQASVSKLCSDRSARLLSTCVGSTTAFSPCVFLFRMAHHILQKIQLQSVVHCFCKAQTMYVHTIDDIRASLSSWNPYTHTSCICEGLNQKLLCIINAVN